VAELFGACDVAVVPRGDGGTSGSLLLACSLGLPVVAADAGASAELLRETGAGWTFVPDDPESLRDVLELAAADPAEIRRRGEASHAEARRRAWPELADRTARLLEGTRGRTR
jgi:glycosyltransferase involved in cell wall biosynthesis